jgi:hypothetical protein
MISKLELEKYLRNKKNAGSRHNFHEQTYFKPTFCIHCSGLVRAKEYNLITFCTFATPENCCKILIPTFEKFYTLPLILETTTAMLNIACNYMPILSLQLWGLIRQGFKCRNCGVNAHKYCKDYMLHECKMGPLLYFPSPGEYRTAILNLRTNISVVELGRCLAQP